MRQGALYLPILLVAIAGCQSGDSLSPTAGQPSTRSAAAPHDFAQETHVDYVKPPTAAAAPVATTESADYSLENGGARWFTGSGVEYAIAGTQPIANANSAVTAGVATVDGFITTRSFTRKDATTQTNPCTGSASTITWASIDGPGNIVAATGFCYVVATKEIVGFTMTIDKDESWSIVNNPTTTLDVQNTVTHEFGHAAGLGHVHAPKDGCLTMYPYVALGETQKRTLGLGDKLGMQVLYNSTDVTVGTCGS
jgi:Matrixin